MNRFLLRVRIILFLFFLSAGFSISASDRKISGKVVDENSGEPVIGATVILENTNLATLTDIFGRFAFSSVSDTTRELLVTSLGFSPEHLSLNSSTRGEIKVSMKRKAITLSEISINPNQTVAKGETVTSIDKIMRPVSSSQDLLRLVPGLFIAQHAGGGKAEQIFIRGFDCDHGTDFNISVDGMPVNMVSHAHGQGYADFHFVIPETIDRLNIYKGPFDARFGDFSTSGTGEFFTKNSIDHNEIKVEAGMFDTYRTMAMMKLPEGRHLLSKSNENAYFAGEYVYTNSYFDKKQNFDRLNLFGKYSAFINPKNFLSFSASTFKANWKSSGQIPERAVEEGLIDRFGSIDSGEGGNTMRTNMNASVTTSLPGNAFFKQQMYFVRYDFNLFSDFTFFLNDPLNGDEINQVDKRNILGYSATFQKEYKLGKKSVHFNSGLATRNDFTHLALKHSIREETIDTIVSGKVTQQNTNGYADATLTFNSHFSINAGLRIDYFDFQFMEDRRDSLSGKRKLIRTSPKLNFYYSPSEKTELFLKSGIGFHSNDARSVVINHTNNSLPKAYSVETGTELKPFRNLLIHIAVWTLYLEHELVYTGDEGTSETNAPTWRRGIDLSARYELCKNLFADIDMNYSHGRLVGIPAGENFIPLAPNVTSTGGLTYKREIGWNGSIRYRYMDSRPANETASVIAKGYFLLDAVCSYKTNRFEFGLSAENLLNSSWNQAQFATESRLRNETGPITELHFTPGTPFFLKGMFCARF